MSSVSSSCPVSNIKVVPSYGKYTCAITWDCDAVFSDYKVNVFKSRDGYTDWYYLGTADAYTGYFLDEEFIVSNQTLNYHYKLSVVSPVTNKSVYDSPSIGLFYTLNREEFSAVKSMVTQQCMLKDNIVVFLCRPKGKAGIQDPVNKNMAETINLLTGDSVGTATDTTAYGKVYDGGFSTPIRTKIIINQIAKQHIDDQNGQGYRSENVLQIRTIAYPMGIVGDMFVDIKTDDRWLINEIVSIEKFKGVVPVTYTANVRLLPRNAIEYKYDLRQLLKDGGCAID